MHMVIDEKKKNVSSTFIMNMNYLYDGSQTIGQIVKCSQKWYYNSTINLMWLFGEQWANY